MAFANWQAVFPWPSSGNFLLVGISQALIDHHAVMATQELLLLISCFSLKQLLHLPFSSFIRESEYPYILHGEFMETDEIINQIDCSNCLIREHNENFVIMESRHTGDLWQLIPKESGFGPYIQIRHCPRDADSFPIQQNTETIESALLKILGHDLWTIITKVM